MVEIRVGSELDRAVSEVVARFVTVHPEGVFSPSLPIPFLPSVDLNSAFDAAEAVGLFKDGDHVLRQEVSDESWEVARLYFSSEVIVSSEATPALAICAAILALEK